MHDTDKWTTPQERKKFENNNNFKDETLKIKRAILMSVSGLRLQCSW
jgi:hypothetical protein